VQCQDAEFEACAPASSNVKTQDLKPASQHHFIAQIQSLKLRLRREARGVRLTSRQSGNTEFEARVSTPPQRPNAELENLFSITSMAKRRAQARVSTAEERAS